MKPVHLYASLGALLVIGSFPGSQGNTKCAAKTTCETVQSCVTRHKGSPNAQSLLFPCPDARKGRTNVCCPTVEDPAITQRGRLSAMKQFDLEICGRETSERIKNGFEAKSGEFPWMALLGYTVRGKPKTYEFLCGGTLITKQFVLTAAHCISTPDRTLKIVRLGELDIRTDPDCIYANVTGQGDECAAKVVERKVVRYLKHEQYSLRELKNDIALLWLDQPITLSDTVRPICLPFNHSTIGHDVKLRVSGWGKLDHDNDAGSPVLQWAFVNTTSNEDCNALIAPGNREISSSQICASGYTGEDACKGDSGGPLMYLDPELSAAVQVGIVSYGLRKCGMLNSPTVYTRVHAYTDWILDSMQKP